MSVSLLIIIVTVLLSMYAWKNPELQSKWLMNPYQIVQNKQWYRLFTSGFIHANWVHLGFNMFTFFFFGRVVEMYFKYIFGDIIGISLFVLMYLSAMAVADITTIRKYKDKIHYNALGASGAVSAMVFASILFDPLANLCLYGILCLPGFIFGLLYIIYSYYQGKRMADNINHDAHLWGALYGAVFTIIVWPSIVMHFIEELKGFSIF